MNEIDKSWLKWIILSLIIGFCVGKLISIVIGLLLNPVTWAVLIAACEPASMVLALLIVLACYQKEKEKTIE